MFGSTSKYVPDAFRLIHYLLGDQAVLIIVIIIRRLIYREHIQRNMHANPIAVVVIACCQIHSPL